MVSQTFCNFQAVMKYMIAINHYWVLLVCTSNEEYDLFLVQHVIIKTGSMPNKKLRKFSLEFSTERPASRKFQSLILDARYVKNMIFCYSQIGNDILSTSNRVDFHIS